MPKINKNVTIDVDVVEYFRKHKLDASKTCNTAMRSEMNRHSLAVLKSASKTTTNKEDGKSAVKKVKGWSAPQQDDVLARTHQPKSGP